MASVRWARATPPDETSKRGPCSAQVEIHADGQVELKLTYRLAAPNNDRNEEDVSRWNQQFTAHLTRILCLAVPFMTEKDDQIPVDLTLQAVGDLKSESIKRLVILPVVQALRDISEAVHAGPAGGPADCLGVEVLGITLPRVSAGKSGLIYCDVPRSILGAVDGIRDSAQVAYIAVIDGRGKNPVYRPAA